MGVNKAEILKVINVEYLYKEIKQLQLKKLEKTEYEKELITVLVDALVKHGKSYDSIQKTAKISRILAHALGFDERYCAILEEAAKIYDIGNIHIAREIYAKNERLSFEEFNVVKNHTYFGAEILDELKIRVTEEGSKISLQHHEWWDGGGYPKQLKGKEINSASRIVALADTVGALFHTRPGRQIWGFEKIVSYVEERSNIQFDPEIVEAFIAKKRAINVILQTKFSKKED